MLSPPRCSHTVPTGRWWLPKRGCRDPGGQHPAPSTPPPGSCAAQTHPEEPNSARKKKTQTLLFPHPRARDLRVLRRLLLCAQFGPCREMGTPPNPPVPGWKRALEAQVRAQLSFLPVLLQVRVARGGTEPDRHFTSSEGHAPAGDDKRGTPVGGTEPRRDPLVPPQLAAPCGVGPREQHPTPRPSSSLSCHRWDFSGFWGQSCTLLRLSQWRGVVGCRSTARATKIIHLGAPPGARAHGQPQARSINQWP